MARSASPSSPSLSSSSSSSSPHQKPSHPSQPSYGLSLLPHLRLASHASALVFSTFLVVHLASPVAAALHTTARLLTGSGGDGSVEGSIDAANGYLLLGRVWYRPGGEGGDGGGRIGWTEGVVVWGSLAVHVGCGVAKRAILLGGEARKRRRRRRRMLREGKRSDEEAALREEKALQQEDQSKALDGDEAGSNKDDTATASTSSSPSTASLSSPPPSNLPTPSLLHALTGQLLLLPLGAHVLLTRLGTATRSLSKEGRGVEVDHSLVAHGLVTSKDGQGTRKKYAAISWAVLVGTTVLSAWHVAGGTHLIGQRLAARRKMQRRRRRAAAAGASLSAEPDVKPRPPSTHAQQLARTANPALLGSMVVLAGVGCIAADYAGGAGHAVGPWARKRFDEVYRGTWPWSLVRG